MLMRVAADASDAWIGSRAAALSPAAYSLIADFSEEETGDRDQCVRYPHRIRFCTVS
jgi:hypothetical protein